MRVNPERIRADLERLAEFGREPSGGVTRPAFSKADTAAREWFATRARDAGLPVLTDPLGNVIVGGGTDDSHPAVWTGSHLDSVPNGGIFDGALGAVAALECVRRLHEEGVPLARPVRAVAFADEEGAFYGYLGSKGLVRDFTGDELAAMTDRKGRPLLDALRERGVDPASATATALAPGAVHRFVELHIEQGPVLESTATMIGVVTDIVGVHRSDVRFDGRSDHAGTTPMNLRRDALRGAAAFLDRLPELPARAGRADAVVTCGHLTVRPGAENVVPDTAVVHLDFRDGSTEGLGELERLLIQEAQACAARHGVDASYRRENTTAPIHLDVELSGVIEQAAHRLGLSTRRLPSGAGHDAQVMAALAPTAMIFVPSCGGRSHCPQEWTSWQDIEQGSNVLLQTVLELAGAGR